MSASFHRVQKPAMPESRPFVSEAQRRKWVDLVNLGRITKEQFAARDQATGSAPLPERATPRMRTVGPSRAPDSAKLGDQRY